MLFVRVVLIIASYELCWRYGDTWTRVGSYSANEVCPEYMVPRVMHTVAVGVCFVVLYPYIVTFRATTGYDTFLHTCAWCGAFAVAGNSTM